MTNNRPYLDFREIKARVTMTDVLGRYGVDLGRVNATSLKGTCPLPSHSSGRKNTFFVNEAKSVWYCHSESCRKNGGKAGGNVIDLVAAMEHCSAYDAAKRIDEMFPARSPAAKSAPEPDTEGKPGAESNAATATGNKALTFVLKDVNPSHPMIQDRGISVATATLFGIGFFPGRGSMAGRIVFPLNKNGILVGYAGRTTLPVSEKNPKWLFGKGLKKTFLYGLDRCDPAKPLILCESLWAPLWFREHGMQAAALMGSEMTEEQERCLDPFPVITVALDNDAAGIDAALRISAQLKPKHRVWKARLIE